MEKEDVYKRIDDYLDYLLNPINKTEIRLNKLDKIDANAIKTLKHYKLIVYRFPLDESNSMVDLTAAGFAVKPAGGIKTYIDIIESKRNNSAVSAPVNHPDLSHKSNDSLDSKKPSKKKAFVKYEKPRPGQSYLILGIIVVLLAVYKVLHEMQIIDF
jgi:hypothetical protein